VYKEKIIASLDKLANGELKALWERIQFDFVPDIGEKAMLRDDIKDKVSDIITSNLTDPRLVVQEQHNWVELNMDAVDVTELSCFIEAEFDIDFISPDAVSKWNTVADIVNYIEDQLEGKDNG